MVVVTAISVGLAAYSAGAGFFASVAAGFGAMGAFGSFLVQAAIGFALNALAPKPKVRGANRGYQVNTRGSALDHQIIYGEARVGGAIIFEESVEGATDDPDVDNQFLLRVYAHAGHEIEGYQEVYIDGKKVTEWRRADNDAVVSGPSAVANGVGLVPYTVCDVRSNGTVIPESEDASSCSNRYGLNSEGARVNNMVLRFYDGTQTTADPTLVADSNSWNTDCVLNDTAYMEVYPNGVPEVTCTIKGKKCFDPRNGTTAYSQNPAICIRDYLTNEYGLNEDAANIDDNLVATAANVCDEIVEVGINRYTCKGAFATSVEPADILSDLLTSMGGLLWYSQGKWRMKPAYWTPPTLTLTEDDLRSSIAVKTRHSRRDNFNVVKGTFRGAETNWQVTDYPQVPVPDNNPFLAVDGGNESVIDLDLPFTDNHNICRRIARIFLERNRQQLTISGSFGLRAFGLQIGDNVNLTLERFGWVEKTFEVNSWTFGLTDNNDLQVQMTLREISENVFDEVADGAIFELDNTTLADPFLTATPTNLTAIDSGFINTDGTFVNSIAVSWNVVKDNLVDYYVFEWKRSTAAEYNSVDLTTKNYEIPGVEDGVQYDIRVKSVNTVGVSSDYASITFTPVSDTTAPSAPTNLSAVGGLRKVALQWQPPTTNTDASTLTDLSGHKIYRSLDNIFGNSILAGTIDSDTFVDEGLSDTTTYYYWVSAVDNSGNESATVGPEAATTEFISAADMVDNIRDEIGAARIDVVSSLPSGSGFDVGDFVFLTSDKKLYEWTGSAWVPVVGDIPFESITETEISDNAISTPKLQANSVTTSEILAGSITSDELAANSVIAGKISAGAVSADKIAVNELAAINANLGSITAGSIDTVSGGSGIRVNTPSFPDAFYAIQNSTSTYALFGSNIANGGGTAQLQSDGGFTLQAINSLDGSGGFGAYVAISAQHNAPGGGQGQVGISNAGGGYGFNSIRGGYYDSSGVGYNPFTGRHDGMIDNTATYELGDIVCDKSTVVVKLSDSFTELEVSSTAEQKGVVGVLAKKYDTWYTPASFIDQEATRISQENHTPTPDDPAGPIVTTHDISDYENDFDLVVVNAVGEGAINVCGEGGDIQAGDLIVASSLAGKGMKQSDDIVRNYTVAKAREGVTFSSATEVKQVACIYMCG
jgi:hypothetical protein